MQKLVTLRYKTLQKMIGKSPKKEQRDLFRPLLEDFIDNGGSVEQGQVY